MIDTRPITIEPNGWYTDSQARLLLDVPSATLIRARQLGRLRSSKAGRHVMYLGQWLIDWLSATVDNRQNVKVVRVDVEQ